jgi:hypothetical protein
MDLPEFGILTEDNTLDTRDRVIAAYVDIATKARKPADQIRALDKIAELRGFKVDRMITDLKSCSPEELESIIEELIIPALTPYDVKGLRRKVVDDVPLDD